MTQFFQFFETWMTWPLFFFALFIYQYFQFSQLQNRVVNLEARLLKLGELESSIKSLQTKLDNLERLVEIGIGD